MSSHFCCFAPCDFGAVKGFKLGHLGVLLGSNSARVRDIKDCAWTRSRAMFSREMPKCAAFESRTEKGRLEVSVVAAQSESDNLAPAAVAATAAQSDEPSLAEFDSAHLATDSSFDFLANFDYFDSLMASLSVEGANVCTSFPVLNGADLPAFNPIFDPAAFALAEDFNTLIPPIMVPSDILDESMSLNAFSGDFSDFGATTEFSLFGPLDRLPLPPPPPESPPAPLPGVQQSSDLGPSAPKPRRSLDQKLTRPTLSLIHFNTLPLPASGQQMRMHRIGPQKKVKGNLRATKSRNAAILLSDAVTRPAWQSPEAGTLMSRECAVFQLKLSLIPMGHCSRPFLPPLGQNLLLRITEQACRCVTLPPPEHLPPTKLDVFPNHACERDYSVHNVHHDSSGVMNDGDHHDSDSVTAAARFDESVNESPIPTEDSILPIDDSGDLHDTGYSSEMEDDHLERLGEDVKRLTHEIAFWKGKTAIARGLLKKAGVEYEKGGEEGEEGGRRGRRRGRRRRRRGRATRKATTMRRPRAREDLCISYYQRMYYILFYSMCIIFIMWLSRTTTNKLLAVKEVSHGFVEEGGLAAAGLGSVGFPRRGFRIGVRGGREFGVGFAGGGRWEGSRGGAGLGEGAADCSGERQVGRAARQVRKPPAQPCSRKPTRVTFKIGDEVLPEVLGDAQDT
ncbi:hypothetical protein B0H14DRAFT_2616990 [Mycena olivaceomarginata]|nr:hypothetical protein B0H14DRAFT_2616990 [Mycena olivaceomarginata]